METFQQKMPSIDLNTSHAQAIEFEWNTEDKKAQSILIKKGDGSITSI